MKRIFLFAALSFWISAVQSQTGYWRDEHGKPVPETESMKSRNGFAGSLLAVTDEDWEKKWNTPPETKPNFNKAGVVPYGKKVFVLIFFSNPAQDSNKKSEVNCEIKFRDPAGKVILSQQGLTCFSGKLKGSPYHMYLSAPVLAFSGDPGDPAGVWAVEVMLRDAIRKVEFPLRTTFELK